MNENPQTESRLNRLPGYAGMMNVTTVGLSVDVCAEKIGRFTAVKRAMVRVAAGRMTGIPEWELKAFVARTLWEDALACRELEKRLRELRGHPSMVTKILQYPLGDFFTELIQSPDSMTLCIGWFEVLAPSLIAALRRYLSATQPLVDQPSIRLLRQILAEEEERLDLGRRFLEVLSAGRDAERADWREHFQAFLKRAGQVWGDPVCQADTPAPAPRATEEEFHICREFKRDERFRTTLPKIPPAAFQSDHLHNMMWTRSQEMTAAELMASVLYEWEDLPIDGVVDLARHCWDETRHSLFGCAAFEAEGRHVYDFESWVGYAHHTLPAPPQKRYSHLAIATEAAMMAYPGGKRGEWELCRDQFKHPLMTTFQDFDWADEVNHVGFGRRWLIEHFLKGNRDEARKLADETVAERKAYYAKFSETPSPPAGGY